MGYLTALSVESNWNDDFVLAISKALDRGEGRAGNCGPSSVEGFLLIQTGWGFRKSERDGASCLDWGSS